MIVKNGEWGGEEMINYLKEQILNELKEHGKNNNYQIDLDGTENT